jgi:hypothetical protein
MASSFAAEELIFFWEGADNELGSFIYGNGLIGMLDSYIIPDFSM